jgi:hypothetical protein
MNTVRVRLRRSVTMRARGHSRYFSADLASSDQPVILQNGQSHGFETTMQVPNGIQHTVSARLINCAYDVVLQGATSGCCVSNVTLNVPTRYAQRYFTRGHPH